ncbi:phenolpthiocerol synthesis polyketide synthase ppsA [Ophiocordyceps sinensis CO18]|uniref:Phenolpthiocerol synthesis polyketide synthase ppsA n=1 Tax=Ophiocordyceps sinensis (strain Co18 / CGMCC 3.14243) TaxID=911162 RepID=T5AL71_OPHSC|nr:phenolpthiocerol synthesis polyketide synthase ppsA [Ophiocordyceps sinensis CO18]
MAPSSNENSIENDSVEAIAVVGFDVKLPQDADTPENFWKLLLEGRSAMTEVPKDRWNVDAFYHPDPDRLDTMHARGGHFIKEDVSLFDAPFFSMSAAEAAAMDPQHRSLLECTYHAFERAGIPIQAVAGSRTSCYVGSFSRDYETVVTRDPLTQPRHTAVGVGTAMLANRLSWFYDMRGPSLSLDTACSSSLVALHLAVQSMRNGESDMAVVAGCNLMLNPETNSIPLSNLGFLGRDSVCYSFDHRANGYARGEVLRISPGLERRCRRLRPRACGKTALQGPSEQSLGRQRPEPGRVGDATPQFPRHELLGVRSPDWNPLEAKWRHIIRASELPWIKDHKFNGSELYPAAGMMVMAVEAARQMADPNLQIARYSLEHVSFFRALLVNLSPEGVETHFHLRPLSKTHPDCDRHLFHLYSISSGEWVEICRGTVLTNYRHGAGDLGEAGPLADRLRDGFHRCKQYVDSRTVYENLDRCGFGFGPTFQALKEIHFNHRGEAVASLDPRGWMDKVKDSRLAQDHVVHPTVLDAVMHLTAVYTLARRRTHMPWKSFIIAKSVPDLQRRLADDLLSKPRRSSASLRPTLAFVFTGQGAQWHAMGRQLSAYPAFRNSLVDAETCLAGLGCEWKVTEELSRDQGSSRVDDPALAQPLCTILQIALLELLAAWDVSPSAVVGHSSGEIAAAYCAGAISKASAYKIAYFRGAVTAKLSQTGRQRGSMMAVGLSEAHAQPYLEQVMSEVRGGQLVVGCVNSPKSITVSGDEACVDHLKTVLDTQGVFARKLAVPVAYHSSQMHEVASEYLESIHDIVPKLQDKALPSMFSSVTGRLIHHDEASRPEYWVRNMLSQVRFSAALAELCESLQDERQQPDQTEAAPVVLVEVGPRSALRRPVQETLEAKGDISYESVLAWNVDAVDSALELVGKLHCRGHQSNLLAVNAPNRAESEMQLLVDLPRYPFNHSQRHWFESRIDRNFRLREFPRHELLGVRSPDWNPLEAKWRHIIRASELPWIKDHKFNGSELYPAAGMMVMAVEAARQMADPNLQIASYSLEHVSFFRALLVNLSPEGVETHFHLRPLSKTHPDCDRHLFHLYSISSGEWVEICRGTVLTNYRHGAGDLGEAGPLADRLRDGFHRCKQYVDSRTVYENLDRCGFGFGPTFQALKEIHFNHRGEAVASLDPRGWMDKVKDSRLAQDHVVHPTVLDAVMHLTAVGDSAGTWNRLPTFVPTKIASLWVSNQLLTHAKGQKLRIAVRPLFSGYRDSGYTAAAYDSVTEECQILLDGYQATAVTSLEPDDAAEYSLGFDFDWKPDVELLAGHQLSTACCQTISNESAYDPRIVDKVELLCHFYLKSAIGNLEAAGFSTDKTHVNRYMDWMKKHVDDYEAANPTPNPEEGKPSLADSDYFQRLLAELPGTPESELYRSIGKDLPDLVRGEMDALNLLFTGENRAQGFYSSASFRTSNEAASTYVDLLAHKDPAIKILEVGAGTGGVSAAILDKLAVYGNGDQCQLRCSKYTYTDISPGFFEAAGHRFRQHAHRTEFKVLDVEKDPVHQGFDENAYDVVIASAVIHATSCVSDALRNLHRLLKPNGKLVLVEPSNPTVVRVAMVFGLLPGWWLGVEEDRYWSPLLSEHAWEARLREAGFTGVDVCFRDYQDHRRQLSVITSAAAKPEQLMARPLPRILVLVPDDSGRHHPLAMKLEESFQALGTEAKILPYGEVLKAPVEDAFCVSLLEVERPFLLTVQHEDWERLKALTRRTVGIVWVTRGRENDPALGLIVGLGRGILTEVPKIAFVDLALGATCTDAAAANHITKVLQAALRPGPVAEKENEYEEQDGILHINRLVSGNWLTDHVAKRVLVQRPQQQRLDAHQNEETSLTIRKPGVLSSLYFEASWAGEAALEADGVELSVRAVGLSFKDCMAALGQLPANTLSLEASGVVLRVGAAVSTHDFKPGDHVCGLAAKAFSTKVRTSASALIKMPSTVSFTAAASIPVSFAVAYQGLVHLGNIQPGESVLILSGAGGVGQAAIQLAVAAGADIYTTVGSTEKKELLMKQYGIPGHRIFVGRNAPFARELKKTVEGVNLVLGSLDQGHLRQSFDCTLPSGRVVDILAGDKRSWEALPGAIFASNTTYSTIDLAQMLDKSKPLIRKLMTSIGELLATSQIKAPSPINTFHASAIEDAFRFLQSGTGAGKTVIEMHGHDMVPVVPCLRATWNFRKDASYVIVGGLGGLGRSTARWMVGRGARNLVLLSRSGAKGKDALDFLYELASEGVTAVAPPCDITNHGVLASVLATCAETMPPVRGCIQGAMVLRDDLFENMSVEGYHSTIDSKAVGSWNLHLVLPDSLDFFILLASGSGITGTRGQANYASGNTYLDALARYRVARGQVATGLDLGLVLGVGFAAENRESLVSVTKLGFRGIVEKEYLGILDCLCDPRRSIPMDPRRSQVLTGLEMPRYLYGHEGKLWEAKVANDWMRWVPRPLFRNLAGLTGLDTPLKSTKVQVDVDVKLDYSSALAAAGDSPAAAARVIASAVQSKLARTLHMPEQDIETQKPMHTYGVDSLVAVELRYWFQRELRAEVSVFELLSDSSIGKLSWLVAERSKLLLLEDGKGETAE